MRCCIRCVIRIGVHWRGPQQAVVFVHVQPDHDVASHLATCHTVLLSRGCKSAMCHVPGELR
jgi:hypothetical protein